jgi:PAS domain S-box-containing protein
MGTVGRTHSARITGVGSQPAIARLVEMVADTTGSELALAYLVLGGTLMVLACLGADPITVGDKLPLDESLSGEIVRTGLPLIVANVAADPALAGRDLVRSHDLKSYAGFPVRGEDGQVVAVLAVGAHRTQPWTPRQLRCLDDVAQLLADVLSCGGGAGPVPKSPVLRGESLFEGLLDAAPDAIIGATADGTIMLINAQAERLFGYRREELIGQSIDLLVPETFRAAHPGHRTRYSAQPRNRPMGAELALTAVRKDGTEFPAEISLSALTTARGLIVSAAVRDVTDRHIAQAERERLIRQAERDAAERRLQHARRMESLGELARGVAHDFNDILAVIGNYTELVRESLSEPTPGRAEIDAACADLEQVSRAADRAARLTRQLLAFGRRDVARTEALDLNRVVGDVHQMLHRTIGGHIRLVTDLEPALRAVIGDATEVEQILVNLVVNARDAMPAGGTVSIGTANADLGADDVTEAGLPAGRYVRLRISDTGNGMTPEVMERAFEPFYTTKPRGSGTGLGLATVYGIVRAAGGDVSLCSEPGAGTTITILLPAVAHAAAEPAAAVAVSRPAATPGATILVVEEEDALRQVTARILAHAGYDVLAAAGGAEAVHLARSHPSAIDLLLTDVMMPGMPGNETAGRVQAIRPHTRVLYMSGHARPVLAGNGTLPDGVDIVEKPFTGQELLDRVRLALRGTAVARR